MCKHVYIHTIPLVLKKHSPPLYTELHGTLALRNNNKAKSTLLAEFVISLKEQMKKERLHRKTKQRQKANARNVGLTFFHCDTRAFSFKSSLSAPLAFIHPLLVLLFIFSLMVLSASSAADVLSPRAPRYLYERLILIFLDLFPVLFVHPPQINCHYV